MDAFWAGLAVGFGVLLLGRVEKKALGNAPGLPSFRPAIAPDSSGAIASAGGAAPDSCHCCGTGPVDPSVTVLGTPFAPAPVTIAPASPYTGQTQWYGGAGPEGPGAATWGAN